MRSSCVIEMSPGTNDTLNIVANNDLKAVSYVGLTEVGQATGITCSGLGSMIAAHVRCPDVYQAVRAYPKTFQEGGFVASGTALGANGRPAKFYTANRQAEVLPVIGSLVSWSEAHDRPLITTLSTTASKGESRGPANTIQIFDGLLKGLSIAEMGLPGYARYGEGEWQSSHNTRLYALVKSGIVIAKDDPISCRILDPIYKGNKPFNELLAGTKAMYKTLAEASRRNRDHEWSTTELETIADDLSFVDDTSRADFRIALIRAISKRTPKYSPGAVEKQNIPQGMTYTLSPPFANMIADLVDRIARVDSSPSYCKESRDYAIEAFRSQDVVARVAKRGFKNSPHAKNHNTIVAPSNIC